MAKNNIDLPLDYAIVLQQIESDGEDDITSLGKALNLNRARLAKIVSALRKKGLVIISDYHSDMSVRLSRKGEQVIHYLWPENSLKNSPF
ncbi:MAG: hypothetical protein WCH00_01380 [Candidatus Saccharibacteria bacterium]